MKIFEKCVMRRNFKLMFCLVLAQAIFTFSAAAQGGKDLEIISESNKVALVIGNANYQNQFSSLNSPRNDANAMGAALKRLGFRLVGGKVHLDASYQEMLDLVDRFTDEIKRGGVGFFYFSGHGSQDGNRDNFLVPVNMPIKYQGDLRSMALKVEFVTQRMEEAGNRLNILVLDACRNNPLPNGFKSGGKNGLNTTEDIPSGVYIAFAARDGQTALDGGNDGYSLYTRELLKNIEVPNERLEDIFIRTRIAVKNATVNKQFPMDYGSLDGKFFFRYEAQIQTPVNPSNRIKEAEEFFNLGYDCASTDYDCKISNYSKAINLNPNYSAAYINRGIAFDDKLNYDRALEDYDKAIEIDPNYAPAYTNRGVTYGHKSNYEQAIKDYNKAIELDSKYAEAYYNRGTTYYDKKDYDRTISDLSRAIELNPNKANYFVNRGNAYKAKENYERALQDYTQAIGLNANYAVAFNNRGSVYDDKKDYRQAILEFTRAIELEPKDATYYKNRAISYEKLGETAKAAADRQRADALEK